MSLQALEYLGPRRVGLSPVGACHSQLCSAGSPLLLLQLNTLDPQGQSICLYCDLFVLLQPPDSSKELACPLGPSCPISSQ